MRSFTPRCFLVFGLVLLAGCTTFHADSSKTGYSAKQLARNVFCVSYPANVQLAPREATELCLIGCAEVTQAYGFTHFVVLDNTTGQRSGSPTLPQAGDWSYINCEPGPASATNTIACFRQKPLAYPEAYEANAVLRQLATQYGVRKGAETRANPLDSGDVQFDVLQSFLLLPRTKPEQILFLDPRTERQTILIGGLREWENPCLTIEEFKEKAAITAGALGADAVQIQSEGDPARIGASMPSRSFAASLLLIPRARLGLEGESKRWPRNDLVVRGFAKESLAPGAGLKVGDRIVALNGVDVLREKRCAQAWLSWAVGESVVVTFVRDGKEMSLQAKTIAN